MGSPMTIVSALIGSLMFGASGYFAGHMMGASKAIIVDLKQQISLGGEAEKYARGMLKLMTRHRCDLLRLERQWKEPIR
jgi:hypothetical protein